MKLQNTALNRKCEFKHKITGFYSCHMERKNKSSLNLLGGIFFFFLMNSPKQDFLRQQHDRTVYVNSVKKNTGRFAPRGSKGKGLIYAAPSRVKSICLKCTC